MRSRKRLHLFPKKRGYMEEGNPKAIADTVGHGWVRTATFSPNGKTLATGGGGELILWSVEQKCYLGEMPVEKGVSAVSWVGDRLFAACDDGKVRVYDPATRQCVATVKTGSNTLVLVVAADGKSFITAPGGSWSACACRAATR